MPTKALRILHVIPQLSTGGAERVVADLVRCQADQQDDPKICVLGARKCETTPYGLRVEQFLDYSGGLRDLAGIAACNEKLRMLARDLRPDVIHAHLWPAAPFASLAAAERNIGCVVHIHDARAWLASGQLRSRARRAAYRCIFNRGSLRIIAVSDAVRNYTAQYLPCESRHVRTIRNGIDLTHFHQLKPRPANGRLTVGAVGRFEEEKGFAVLIDAAAELARRGVKVDLAIAGDGPAKTEMQTLAQRLGVNLQLPGVIADMRSFYDQLDLFVLPSFSEGLPISLLEAMGMGLPVVASSVGGIPEVIRDRIDGFLVSPGDPASLANALTILLDDPRLRDQMGRSSRARVEARFTRDAMAKEVREVYQDLM